MTPIPTSHRSTTVLTDQDQDHEGNMFTVRRIEKSSYSPSTTECVPIRRYQSNSAQASPST